MIELGTEGGAGNLVLARIQRIHLNTDFLDENGKLDNTKLDLVGRLGANWYSRANVDALFEIPKPLQKRELGLIICLNTFRKAGYLLQIISVDWGILNNFHQKKKLRKRSSFKQLPQHIHNLMGKNCAMKFIVWLKSKLMPEIRRKA